MKVIPFVLFTIYFSSAMIILVVGFGSRINDYGYVNLSQTITNDFNTENALFLIGNKDIVDATVESFSLFLFNLFFLLHQPFLWFGVKLHETGFPESVFYPILQGLDYLFQLFIAYYILSIPYNIFTKKRLPLGYG